MALTVVSNISSLNAQRNLAHSSDALGKSLERLSSGLRINRAGDDAAGLAISTGLRSQINGLNQAVRNANDGLSLIGTGESAINSYTDILQRIRELAVQSANDTNSSTNRQAINEESNQLLQELQRISSTVEFNGTKLLDGSFVAKQLQVGAQANQSIAISTGDLRTSQLGQVARQIGNAVPATNALAAGDLIINGVDVSPSLADGVSFSNASASAISIANAINAQTSLHGVVADAQPAVFTGAGVLGGGTFDPLVNQFKINNIPIFDATTVVAANDSTSTLRNAINAKTNQTGVTASLDPANHLILTAEDGRNITLVTTGAGPGGSAVGIADELGLQLADGNFNNSATPVGGKVRITSQAAIVVAGAHTAYAGLNAQTYAKDPNTALNMLTLATSAGANLAIDQVDNALSQINNIRAGLGAITNRLEQTVSNLQAISENLSASDSRIRDADFAVETANMTRNQVLQQAGVAILAQANTSTQSALQLLKG